ncbi:MAG TPA: hypothetical protein PKA64_04585, partial [Myxococcota bacterium]|nr:hypothetical protein [Myxococcota bacterium]
VATLDVDGHPDPDVSYVISQTSLDRERAGLRVTRWDTTGAEPREGWTIDLPDARPDCCAARVWRADGVAVLWYERWLAALDDATGAVRWVRRL